MSGTIVALTYSTAALLALVLLYFFHAKRWYWHLMAVAAALMIGVMTPPEGWASQRYDLAIGAIFFFLCLWGIAGMFFRHTHEQPHHG